jgi:hypothetical protein
MKKIFALIVFAIVVFSGCTQKKEDFSIEFIRGNSAYLVNNTQRTAIFDTFFSSDRIGSIYMYDGARIIENYSVNIIPIELTQEQVLEQRRFGWKLMLRPGDKLVLISDGFDKSSYNKYTFVEFTSEVFIDEEERINITLYGKLY